mgnify:FL=1
MSSSGYETGSALWRAVSDKARHRSKTTSRPASEYIRLFTFSRFVARVFAAEGSPWVLKGGTAMLLRVDDARHSKDVDLLRSLGNLDDAVSALRAALDTPMDDHFQFVVETVRNAERDDIQPQVDGCRVMIVAYCGVKIVDRFGVDLVTGSLMTSDPEIERARSPLDMPGVEAPVVRLYPVVDHIADKVCATETVYSRGRGSSRPRDLVDLVVFARTQRIDGTALRDAIRGERVMRSLPARSTFAVPEEWRRDYPPLATSTRYTSDLPTVELATALVARLLDPAFGSTSVGRTWDPDRLEWT